MKLVKIKPIGSPIRFFETDSSFIPVRGLQYFGTPRVQVIKQSELPTIANVVSLSAHTLYQYIINNCYADHRSGKGRKYKAIAKRYGKSIADQALRLGTI